MAKAVKPGWRAGVVAKRHDQHRRTYRDKVKLTFAQGASLDDPKKLFNSSLDGGTRRAIDFHEGDKVDEAALIALVRDAAAFNATKAKKVTQ